MILFLLLSIVFFPFILWRLFKWFSVVQRKEYRLDRIRSFVFSSEGVVALFQIFPKRDELTKAGFKRPHPTARLISVGIIFCFLSGLWFFLFLKTGIEHFGVFLITLTLFYFFLPIFVIVSVAPSSIMAFILTTMRLFQAQQKIQTHHPIVIGITGSYGKTSTKQLLAHVLAAQYEVFFTPKSFNTPYSIAQSVCKLYRGESIAIIEYAAYARGEIARVASYIPPTIGIITGFAPQHVELFGSQENIIRAKAEMVRALPKDAPVFCNAENEKTAEIARQGGKTPTLVRVAPSLRIIDQDSMGHMTILWNGQRIQTQLIGKQYLETIALCIAVAQHLGLDEKQISMQLSSFIPQTSFISARKTQKGALIIDDGKTSNPKGFSTAIQITKSFPHKEKILVTGGIVDLGKESEQIHAELAHQASTVFSQVIYTNTIGVRAFMDAFGSRCITDESEASIVLSQANHDTVICIEGFLPKKYEPYLS